MYSTCLGGGQDGAYGIAADTSGNAYVVGSTQSPNFPTTVGTFQPVPVSSGESAFLTKINYVGGVTYSTYLGGTDGDTFAKGIAITSAGEAYVIGRTTSTRFPQTPPLTPNPTAGFLVKFSTDASTLKYATLLGAEINSVAVLRTSGLSDTFPQLYTVGVRYSSRADRDAFVVKLDENPLIGNK